MYIKDLFYNLANKGKDWTANKVFTYEDTYVFNDTYSKDDMWNYIKTDLALVAGGGYNADHIHIIKYTIGY